MAAGSGGEPPPEGLTLASVGLYGIGREVLGRGEAGEAVAQVGQQDGEVRRGFNRERHHQVFGGGDLVGRGFEFERDIATGKVGVESGESREGKRK